MASIGSGDRFSKFSTPGEALNDARARYFSDLGHFSAMWLPLALGIDFFRAGEALNAARARYFSDLGHFCDMWLPLALVIDF